MIYCCKGCVKRYPGCHGHCEDYISQKKEDLKNKKNGWLENGLNEYAYDNGHKRYVKRKKEKEDE